MKLLVKNVNRSNGISFKTNPDGNQYNICTLVALEPYEPRSWNTPNGKGESEGYGLTDVEYQLDVDLLHTFKDVKFPAFLDLDIETITQNGRPTPVVKGIKKAA